MWWIVGEGGVIKELGLDVLPTYRVQLRVPVKHHAPLGPYNYPEPQITRSERQSEEATPVGCGGRIVGPKELFGGLRLRSLVCFLSAQFVEQCNSP